MKLHIRGRWLMLVFLKVPFLVLHINDPPNDVICNIAIFAGDATLYSMCDQAYDLWQQLDFDSELESDLWDTVDWDRKWFGFVNNGKTQFVSFDGSHSSCAIY